MAKISGAALYAEFGGTDISSTIRSFDVNETQEYADSTASSDTYRNSVSTVKTISVDAEMIIQDFANGGSAIFAALAVGTEGTLIWGQEGTASGKPKKGFLSGIENYTQSFPFDDVATISLSFVMKGTALAFDGVTDTY